MGIFVFEVGYRGFWGIHAFAPCGVIGDYEEGIRGPLSEVAKGEMGFCFRIGLEFSIPTLRPVINFVPGHFRFCRRVPGNGYLCGIGKERKEKKEICKNQAKRERVRRIPTKKHLVKGKDIIFGDGSMREAHFLPFHAHSLTEFQVGLKWL